MLLSHLKSLFIHQLPTDIQDQIQQEITLSLSTHNLSPNELSNSIHTALHSRLSDLEDLINVNKYLTI
jgi:hypothetical protein